MKNKPAWQRLILGVGVKNIFIRKVIRVRMNIPYADSNPLVMALPVLKVKSVVLSRGGTTWRHFLPEERLKYVPANTSL